MIPTIHAHSVCPLCTNLFFKVAGPFPANRKREYGQIMHVVRLSCYHNVVLGIIKRHVQYLHLEFFHDPYSSVTYVMIAVTAVAT